MLVRQNKLYPQNHIDQHAQTRNQQIGFLLSLPVLSDAQALVVFVWAHIQEAYKVEDSSPCQGYNIMHPHHAHKQ